MAEHERPDAPLDSYTRFSFLFMAGLLLLMILLRLATPCVAALFAYLALRRLTFPCRGGKWLAVAIFLTFLSAAAYGLGFFIHQTIHALPEIADKAIPSVIDTAQRNGIELPFTDYDSLKNLAFDTVKSQVRYLGSFAKVARGASTQIVFLAAGCVVAISLFLNPRLQTGPAELFPSVYAKAGAVLSRRFAVFYQSFVAIMGAQIIISAINTVLTAIFVLTVHLPYGVVIIGVSFLCGLVPVVGNLVSNTIIVGIGFTISPKMALVALLFLVAIHKLEYFLNSEIIGWRIQNPLWLTLLGLIIGERLLGLPGMILAPVILYYVKLEAARIPSVGSPQDLVGPPMPSRESAIRKT